MLPDAFWQHDPADTIAYINAQIEARNRALYDEGLVQAQLMGVTLANAFRDKKSSAKRYPTYDELFVNENSRELTPEERLDQRVKQLQAQFAVKNSTKKGHTDGND